MSYSKATSLDRLLAVSFIPSSDGSIECRRHIRDGRKLFGLLADELKAEFQRLAITPP